MSKILVIEDDKLIRDNTESILVLYDYTVYVAENGLTGLALAKKVLPDLIICDIMMPDIEGYEVLRMLQEDTSTKSIPFLFLSAKVSKIDQRLGMSMGADDYITKPFEMDELIEAVTARLKRKENIQAELKNKIDVLTQKNLTRDKVFSVISHDMRNIFTGLLSLLEILQRSNSFKHDPDVSTYLDLLNNTTHSGFNLFENLLQWSKAQQDAIRIKPEKVDLKVFLAQLLKNIRNQFELKSISVSVDIASDIFLICDQTMLYSIFQNILYNSIKFTKKNGLISIRAYIESSSIVISIKDNGMGMSPQKLEQIKGEGPVKSSKGTERERGTGIGILIVKDFVEKSNATIEFESLEGIGTEVILKFQNLLEI